MNDSGFVDLHTHSNYSDGRLTPAELVEEALYKGLAAIALTDHDNVDGHDDLRAAGKARGLEVVAGTELSCEIDDLEVHILGLYLEPNDQLLSRLHEIRVARESRMERMLHKLQEMGFDLNMDEIPQVAGKSFGRPHLAQAMVEKGYVKSISEAFGRYIGDDGPAYVAKERFSVQEAVDLIRECRGVSILAHPGVAGVFPYLPRFLEFGIQGIEAYYPKHTAAITSEIVDFCRRHDLLVSGGSDYHANGEGPAIGVPQVPYSILADIRRRADDIKSRR